MSFQDLEAGLTHHHPANVTLVTSRTREDSVFSELQHGLSLQVFKMNANIQGILKLVDQLGTPRDSAGLRKSLHDLTESTRQMVKRASEEVKRLAEVQQPHQKTAFDKTSHDVQRSLLAFQNAQKVSAEKQRTVVAGVKMAVEHPDDSGGHFLPQQEQEPQQQLQYQQQAQILQAQLSPHELAYQESLITEREAEIREIETGIHELAEIFRDLGTLTGQQGELIDNIESNISSVEIDTGAAVRELNTAAESQRKAGRRAACLMIIVIIVVAIVLLAVLS